MDDLETKNAPVGEPDTIASKDTVPLGIARIREEWREAGLVEKRRSAPASGEIEPVVFPEVDGGAGIGDYVLDCDTVTDRLGLSRDAVERLVSSGELDSILVQGPDGASRRLISESSFVRFQADSAIDPEAMLRAAKAMADRGVAASIDEMRAEVEELRATQGKLLQQMKDLLLLEIRNLKEQDRDLASFVYELAEEIREALPRKKRK